MGATIGMDKGRFLESTGIGNWKRSLCYLQPSPVRGAMVSLFIKSEDEVGLESSGLDWSHPWVGRKWEGQSRSLNKNTRTHGPNSVWFRCHWTQCFPSLCPRMSAYLRLLFAKPTSSSISAMKFSFLSLNKMSSHSLIRHILLTVNMPASFFWTTAFS